LEEKKLSHNDAAVFYFLPAEGVMILKRQFILIQRVSNSQHSDTFLV
jgi:hypothetical protein